MQIRYAIRSAKRLMTQRAVIRQINRSEGSRLHLGCGNEYLRGYVNIDRNRFSPADVVADACNLRFVNDCAVERIESYHFFEHLNFMQACKGVREWYRILKPGGCLIIELPNLEVCLGEIGKHFDDKGFDLAMVGIFGYPPDVGACGCGQLHKWGWTPKTLSALLSSVGFQDVRLNRIRQDWRRATAFNRDMQMRAFKPNSHCSGDY